MTHGKDVRCDEQIDLLDLEGVNQCDVHPDELLVMTAVLSDTRHVLFLASEPTLVVSLRLHQGRVDVAPDATCTARIRVLPTLAPEIRGVVDDEAETVRVVSIGMDFDTNVRGMVPEKEPADDSKE